MGTFLKHQGTKASTAVNQSVVRMQTQASPRASALSPTSSGFVASPFASPARRTASAARSSSDAQAGADFDLLGEPIDRTNTGGSVAPTDDPFASSLLVAPVARSVSNATDASASQSEHTDAVHSAMAAAAAEPSARRTVTSDSLNSVDSGDTPVAKGSAMAFESEGQSERKGVYIRMQVRAACLYEPFAHARVRVTTTDMLFTTHVDRSFA